MPCFVIYYEYHTQCSLYVAALSKEFAVLNNFILSYICSAATMTCPVDSLRVFLICLTSHSKYLLTAWLLEFFCVRSNSSTMIYSIFSFQLFWLLSSCKMGILISMCVCAYYILTMQMCIMFFLYYNSAIVK